MSINKLKRWHADLTWSMLISYFSNETSALMCSLCEGKVNNWSRCNNRGRCGVWSQLHTAHEAKGDGRWHSSSYQFIFKLQEKTECCWDTISTVSDRIMMRFVNQTENTISYRHTRLWNVFDSQWLPSKTVFKTNILCKLSSSFSDFNQSVSFESLRYTFICRSW